ncbi:MAG: TlyA family RNA methyltransferase [Spirochaetia bacterium]
MKKQRLLKLLQSKYKEKSKDFLYSRVLCGEVYADHEKITDPKALVDAAALVELRETGGYVSRGGLKLEAALDAWNITVSEKVVLDAGASTGGFTDCVLQKGAAAVHAVDVGYNQLDYRLRTDERVIVHERTNIMKIDSLCPVPHIGLADLSFRSLRRAAAHILDLVSENLLIALLKPQFEVQDTSPGFSGIVSDPVLLEEIVSNVLGELKNENVITEAVMKSPITGRKGNQEYLLFCRKKT